MNIGPQSVIPNYIISIFPVILFKIQIFIFSPEQLNSNSSGWGQVFCLIMNPPGGKERQRMAY